jgi:protocadherin Fat 4
MCHCIASSTVTILVDDVNDHSPQFVQPLYRTTMSESLAKGASVTSVLATDLDLGINAKLTYTLAERDREHFYISTVDATNTGVVKVFKVC